MLSARWSLRIPLATIFIVVERRWTTLSYLEDELLCKKRDLTKLSWVGK
jgi:hypothetical protein